MGSRQREARSLPGSVERTLKVFAVDEHPPSDSLATFVPALFASEAIATALEKSDFDKWKASFFVWLGGAGFPTVEAALASRAFIGSLPRGSGWCLGMECSAARREAGPEVTSSTPP